MDMSKFSKSEFPAQTRERLQWIIDTVRMNQDAVWRILFDVDYRADLAKEALQSLHKQDRDALLVKGGILTDDQIALLTENSP